MSPLSKKEKLILYGLSLYPHYSDVRMSKFLGITQSTFSTAKRRLRSRNYFKTLYLPAFQKLGCEILFVAYGPFNLMRDDLRTAKIINPEIDVFSRIFFFARGISSGAMMGVARNMGDLKKYTQSLETYMVKKKLIPENSWKMHAYSFEASRVITFLDFHRIINEMFSLGMNVHAEPGDLFGNNERIELTSIEKEMFYNFIRYPEYNDTQLANLLNLSRLTVSKVRKKFEKLGLMRKLCVINMKKIGVNLLVYSHNIMKTGISVEERMDSLKYLIMNFPIILGVISPRDSFTIFCERDYNRYEILRWNLLNYYLKRDYFAYIPNDRVTSCVDVKYPLYISFAPAVSELLGQKNDWKEDIESYFM